MQACVSPSSHTNAHFGGRFFMFRTPLEWVAILQLPTIDAIFVLYNTPIFMHEISTYIPPFIRVVPLTIENAVCGSPSPGGNEDIGYDDWN